jgi:Na+-translocating ferredoxin:NAD+ oxidoreductase RNF subunit RnfB
MTLLIVLLAGGTMLLLAVLMAFVLGWANMAFAVEVDPRVEAVLKVLPGANCGGCGFVGCGEYAEGLVKQGASVNKCTVGGESCAKAIAAILGVEVEQTWPYRPVVHCGAHYGDRLGRAKYAGEPTCGSANLIGGVQGCTYGCLGMGDCQAACPFDAIHIVDGLAAVDYGKCTGCGACARACPRRIITMVPFKVERMVVVTCSNHDFGKQVRAVCKVGCIGCRACTKVTDLFTMLDNLPQIDYGKYDPQSMEPLQAVIAKCPMERVLFIGKPSPEDLVAMAGEKVPGIVRDTFDSTVDKAEWHG